MGFKSLIFPMVQSHISFWNITKGSNQGLMLYQRSIKGLISLIPRSLISDLFLFVVGGNVQENKLNLIVYEELEDYYSKWYFLFFSFYLTVPSLGFSTQNIHHPVQDLHWCMQNLWLWNVGSSSLTRNWT